MLNEEHYRFARQCGATHAVVHLVDYFNQGGANSRSDQPIGDLHGWGRAEGVPRTDFPRAALGQAAALLARRAVIDEVTRAA